MAWPKSEKAGALLSPRPLLWQSKPLRGQAVQTQASALRWIGGARSRATSHSST
jgi:hypothetical protein